FSEIITLHLVTALGGKKLKLLLGLDAFGDERDPKPVAKPDDRADNRRRLRVAPEIHDKGLVDLDLVEGKRLQIGQRGIATAEIVHGDADAKRLQPAQQR